MIAARIHQYQKPLVIEDTLRQEEDIRDEAVLVKVGAAGLCHSDLHLINGEWQKSIPIPLPMTPGHETAGWVEKVGIQSQKGCLVKATL